MKPLDFAVLSGLGLSLLFNVFAFAYLRRMEPVAAAVAETRSEAAVEPAARHEIETIRRALAEETALNEELSRPRKEVPAAPPPGKPSEDKFFDRAIEPFRKALRSFLSAPEGKPWDGAGELMQMWSYVLAKPSEDPSRYAEVVQSVYEAALEAGEMPLTEAQAEQFGRLGETLAEALRGTSKSSAYERQLGELDAQKAYLRGMLDLLSPAQREKLAANNRLVTLENNLWTQRTGFASGPERARHIAANWTRLLNLDPSQATAGWMTLAAQRFADLANRITSEYKDRYGMDPQPRGVASQNAATRDPYQAVHSLDYRAAILRAQMEALESLSGGLTPEQRERLNTQALQSYYFQYLPAQ
ncbi:MAG: hypothetical protein HY716_03610 [Planctomycetes bacterium]|nr:hypothetical protein [Planctomycetota bacterium]